MIFFLIGAALQAPAPRPTQPLEQSVEDEVRTNILEQSWGPGTVADTALPEVFLARAADREIRRSYQDQRGVMVRAADNRVISPQSPEREQKSSDGSTDTSIAQNSALSGTRYAAYLYAGLGAGLLGISTLLICVARKRGEAK